MWEDTTWARWSRCADSPVQTLLSSANEEKAPAVLGGDDPTWRNAAPHHQVSLWTHRFTSRDSEHKANTRRTQTQSDDKANIEPAHRERSCSCAAEVTENFRRSNSQRDELDSHVAPVHRSWDRPPPPPALNRREAAANKLHRRAADTSAYCLQSKGPPPYACK